MPQFPYLYSRDHIHACFNVLLWELNKKMNAQNSVQSLRMNTHVWTMATSLEDEYFQAFDVFSTVSGELWPSGYSWDGISLLIWTAPFDSYSCTKATRIVCLRASWCLCTSEALLPGSTSMPSFVVVGKMPTTHSLCPLCLCVTSSDVLSSVGHHPLDTAFHLPTCHPSFTFPCAPDFPSNTPTPAGPSRFRGCPSRLLQSKVTAAGTAMLGSDRRGRSTGTLRRAFIVRVPRERKNVPEARPGEAAIFLPELSPLPRGDI